MVSQTSNQEKITAKIIEDWLVNYLVELLEVKPEDIDMETPFDRYGLDSSVAVALTGDLEDWLEVDIDPTIIYDYPTIKSLVEYLETEI